MPHLPSPLVYCIAPTSPDRLQLGSAPYLTAMMTASSFTDKIAAYYADYPSSTEYIGHTVVDDAADLQTRVEKLHIEQNRADAFRKEFLHIGGPDVFRKKKNEEGKEVESKDAGSSC